MENNEPKVEDKVAENAAPMETAKKCCAGACKHKKYILGALVLLLIIGYAVYAKNPAAIKSLFTKNITKEQAQAKIVALIGTDNPGVTVKGVTEESGLYKITIGIEGQPDQFAYVTKDGTKFIQQAVLFSDIEKQQADQKKAEEEAKKPVEKSDKPAVDLYVMSFCPFGNKAEDTLKPVYDLLKNKVTFNFHYIVSTSGNDVQSLHGAKEVTEDEREACVLRDYGKDKWFSFATYVNKNCGSDGTCWEAGAKILGVDAAKVNACVAADGVNLMKDNEKDSNAGGASGSPTLKINGTAAQVVYQYGDSEAYKQAICAAFNTAPAECSKKLAADKTAAGTAPGSCTTPAQ